MKNGLIETRFLPVASESARLEAVSVEFMASRSFRKGRLMASCKAIVVERQGRATQSAAQDEGRESHDEQEQVETREREQFQGRSPQRDAARVFDATSDAVGPMGHAKEKEIAEVPDVNGQFGEHHCAEDRKVGAADFIATKPVAQERQVRST